jgi:hypothetical protein
MKNKYYYLFLAFSIKTFAVHELAPNNSQPSAANFERITSFALIRHIPCIQPSNETECDQAIRTGAAFDFRPLFNYCLSMSRDQIGLEHREFFKIIAAIRFIAPNLVMLGAKMPELIARLSSIDSYDQKILSVIQYFNEPKLNSFHFNLSDSSSLIYGNMQEIVCFIANLMVCTSSDFDNSIISFVMSNRNPTLPDYVSDDYYRNIIAMFGLSQPFCFHFVYKGCEINLDKDSNSVVYVSPNEGLRTDNDVIFNVREMSLPYKITAQGGKVTIVNMNVIAPGSVQFRGKCDSLTIKGKKVIINADVSSSVDMSETDASISDAEFFRATFRECKLPESLEQIPMYLFSSSSLQSITIPSSVSIICASAFENCQVRTVIFDGSKLKVVQEAAFCRSHLQGKFVLPDGVEVVEENAFGQCKNLTSFKGGSGLERIDSRAFFDSGVQLIDFRSSPKIKPLDFEGLPVGCRILWADGSETVI